MLWQTNLPLAVLSVATLCHRPHCIHEMVRLPSALPIRFPLRPASGIWTLVCRTRGKFQAQSSGSIQCTTLGCSFNSCTPPMEDNFPARKSPGQLFQSSNPRTTVFLPLDNRHLYFEKSRTKRPVCFSPGKRRSCLKVPDKTFSLTMKRPPDNTYFGFTSPGQQLGI